MITAVRIAVLLGAAILIFGQSRNRTEGNTTGIRSVDFRSFEYEPGCLGYKTAVRTRKGEYSSEDPITGRIRLRVVQIAYGDLDGDGLDEAVVITACNTGGSGLFTEGHLYAYRDARATHLVRLEIGDRALGGISDVRIEGGRLVVTRTHGVAACCPEEVETTAFRLDGSRLVAEGTPERHKVEEN